MAKFTKPDFAAFSGLTFDRFSELAEDESLSRFEKIGFPDQFRADFETAICEDIWKKLPPLDGTGATVLDIGPGCSDLPKMLIDRCIAHDHELILVDSAQMLNLLPDGKGVVKLPGRFPRDFAECPKELESGVDALIVYSVLQHVMLEDNLFAFTDSAMALLKPGGFLLFGDIPNVSKRKRFLNSAAGVAFHKEYMQTDEPPQFDPYCLEMGLVDDGVVLGLIARARNAGFEAYILPQPADLPFANRREDVLIVRP